MNKTLTIPVPTVAPFGDEMSSKDSIQEVWDAFVKPSQQDEFAPQSVEMRVLMAILRAVYIGYLNDEKAAEEKPSNLVIHARRELEIIGEEPETVEGLLKVVQAFAEMQHSGGSASIAVPMITQLLQFKNLAPLTDNPKEWIKHSPDKWDGVNEVWQNVRNGEAFSSDGGKTYRLNSEDQQILHESAHFTPKKESE